MMLTDEHIAEAQANFRQLLEDHNLPLNPFNLELPLPWQLSLDMVLHGSAYFEVTHDLDGSRTGRRIDPTTITTCVPDRPPEVGVVRRLMRAWFGPMWWFGPIVEAPYEGRHRR